MNKFEDIQAFVAVVEAGSFTAAAERLAADKSAISRRVTALENRLGTELLRRTTRALTITDTGNSFYQHAARILADLDEAEAAVAQQHGELQGRLRVALPLSFGVHHLRCPIADFNKAHPGVQMDLDLSDRFVDLLQEGFDVAIRIGNLKDSTLVARRLFESRLVVCASPDYIAEHGAPEKPDDLAAHKCVVYSGTSDPTHWTFIHANGEDQHVRVNPVMFANSGDVLLEAVADGLGIALQPTFLACAFIQSGRVVPILTDYHCPISTGYAVYPPTRHLSHRVRAFIDFLAEHFSGVPSWDCY